jgi:hypothetical protein
MAAEYSLWWAKEQRWQMQDLRYTRMFPVFASMAANTAPT